MCQSELDERANCLRIEPIKPQQKWFFLSVEYQNTTKLPIKTPVQSLLKRTQSREAVVPVAGAGRAAGRGLTSKGKLLGRALGLNAYAHAVCIVWHWSAPAITAQGPSIKNVSDFFYSSLRHVNTFSLFSTLIFSWMFEPFPLSDGNVIYGWASCLAQAVKVTIMSQERERNYLCTFVLKYQVCGAAPPLASFSQGDKVTRRRLEKPIYIHTKSRTLLKPLKWLLDKF